MKFDFVFLSSVFFDKRAKSFKFLCPKSNYLIFFLPSFDFKELYYHFKFFKLTGQNFCFQFFNLADFFVMVRFIIVKWNYLIRLKNTSNLDFDYLFKLIIQFKLYQSFGNRLANYSYLTSNWIFDYERNNFLPIIFQFKQKNIPTLHLQHGFFEFPNPFYFPLYSDYIICCSERERRHYIRFGVRMSQIHVLGAPLNSLDGLACKQLMFNSLFCFDVLILFTTMVKKEYFDFQVKLLRVLLSNFSEKKLLIRFRPSSKDTDYKAIENEIGLFNVSQGFSLIEDVCRCKFVLSFSFDAAFIVHSVKKPLLLFGLSSNLDFELQNLCVTEKSDLYSSLFNFFMYRDMDNSGNFVDLFGETNMEILQKRFLNILNINSSL